MDEVIIKIKSKDKIGPIQFDIEAITKQIDYRCFVNRIP